MQDGATPHRAKGTQDFLRRKLPRQINYTDPTEWPPNSPDLNCIEKVWAWMQDKVIEKMPSSEAQMIEYIEQAWWDIPQNTTVCLNLSSINSSAVFLKVSQM